MTGDNRPSRRLDGVTCSTKHEHEGKGKKKSHFWFDLVAAGRRGELGEEARRDVLACLHRRFGHY
jgi:hypothetical protein